MGLSEEEETEFVGVVGENVSGANGLTEHFF